MINNRNFIKDCVYTALYDQEMPNGKTKTVEVMDVRYNTEVIGGKVCFPMIDEDDQGAAAK